ncbi:MAG: membrane protein insertase YidC [Oscillospiraceae bacterium]|nr:membrane protein insertase YidC [Oscillospiraceae bacterium]
MSLSHSLYQLLIGPLELIFELVYGLTNLILNNAGLAIFALSLTMNFLLLPLYRRADAIQAEEREIEKRLAPWVTHIKKSFTGDERFMMLQTYYRQNNYKPFYALKGSLPLVLEIPFFIAAYHFLSHLSQLRGMPFGPIADLGAPDGLLTIAGVTVHVLPILMTLINVVSSAIYTRGFPLKDKLQLYGMALIFLVLLYGSPSGLVLYWTLNNLFSLFKNLFCRFKNPQALLFGLLAAAGSALLVFGLFFFHPENWKQKPVVLAVALLLMLPLALYLLRRKLGRAARPELTKQDARLFVSGCVFLAALTGLLIPSAVVASSPAEFVLAADLYSPLRHVGNAALLAFGLFVVWMGIFYYMASPGARRVLGALVWIACGIAVVDYMFFGTNLGTLSADLKYDAGVAFSMKEKLLNLAVLAAVAVVFALLYRKKSLVQGVYLVLALAVLGMAGVNVVKIQSAVPEIRQTAGNMPSEKARFTLSKKGENVVVIMLDRAIGAYLPYLMAENPELSRQFAGFTYYPNTITHGYSTNTGSAGLFGGYEYTPAAMNARADEPLEDKQNEALRMLPVLFLENGWEVTVCDPPFAGYSWIPDLSIYDDYPDIRAYNTEDGQFIDTMMSQEDYLAQRNQLWQRNFFCFSLMKIAPPVVQNGFYYHGSYFSPELRTIQTVTDISSARGINSRFLGSYAVLRALPEMTEITDGERDTLLMLANCSTHEPALLSEPTYEPAEVVENAEYDAAHADRFVLDGQILHVTVPAQMEHYQVNMAALIQIGRWLDYLRENDVYDNTRIIIAADHGCELLQLEALYRPEIGLDVMAVNPLLLVKDFDSETFTTDNSFMTNADVPTLAVAGTIDDPVNPFTGKPVTNEAKSGEQLILYGTEHRPEYNNGSVFLPGSWFSVHDDIYTAENWASLGVR